jgi:intracellular sulfur oxidation DsrE/DsrF family protein
MLDWPKSGPSAPAAAGLDRPESDRLELDRREFESLEPGRLHGRKTRRIWEENMDRRSIFRTGLAALAVVPLFSRKAAAAPERKHHKLAIHVDQNDPAVMRLALGNARNTHELFVAAGDDVAIEIVCYSQGLHMVRDDTSPVKDDIRSTRAKVPQLAFSACANTRRAMERTEGRTIPLIEEAVVVPAGVVRLIELQEQGFSYIKP